MSTTNVRRLSRGRTHGAVYYELYGAKWTKKHKENLAAGTDRVAAMKCDLGDPWEYVAYAEQVAEAKGRKCETHSLIQSFEKSEFDPSDPDAVQRVNDAGYALAKRLHPDSLALVITHVDGAGGHPHNHIKIVNHNERTGLALRHGHLHHQVQKVNDELAREWDLRVIEPTWKTKVQQQVLDGETVTVERTRASYWEDKRSAKGAFDQKLGDRVDECMRGVLADPELTRENATEKLTEALGLEGVALEAKVSRIKPKAAEVERARRAGEPEPQGHDSIGWTYKMLDDTDEDAKPRVRRRKASTFSDDLTAKGWAEQVGVELAEREAVELAREAAAEESIPDSVFAPPRTRGKAAAKTPERPAEATAAPEPVVEPVTVDARGEGAQEAVRKLMAAAAQEPEKPEPELESVRDDSYSVARALEHENAAVMEGLRELRAGREIKDAKSGKIRPMTAWDQAHERAQARWRADTSLNSAAAMAATLDARLVDGTTLRARGMVAAKAKHPKGVPTATCGEAAEAARERRSKFKGNAARVDDLEKERLSK
ncbi:MAG: relaxase/mobilization nuclease domain-containing protein [Gordonia sp. (in: high G+C Gram-positive bacteria)]|uniref:relaxase/mobilization nuclease domain-containing protein n=1 Tax=Gordonia sp. (in: high G+C Gram-positive bacteria) TaxID=84139 RepID=UPI003C756AAA